LKTERLARNWFFVSLYLLLELVR